MVRRVVPNLAGVGRIDAGKLTLLGAVYSIRLFDDGRAEGTILANFSAMFPVNDVPATLHLDSKVAVRVMLQAIRPTEGRASILIDGPITRL
jgi:hypothetical protein